MYEYEHESIVYIWICILWFCVCRLKAVLWVWVLGFGKIRSYVFNGSFIVVGAFLCLCLLL